MRIPHKQMKKGLQILFAIPVLKILSIYQAAEKLRCLPGRLRLIFLFCRKRFADDKQLSISLYDDAQKA